MAMTRICQAHLQLRHLEVYRYVDWLQLYSNALLEITPQDRVCLKGEPILEEKDEQKMKRDDGDSKVSIFYLEEKG